MKTQKTKKSKYLYKFLYTSHYKSNHNSFDGIIIHILYYYDVILKMLIMPLMRASVRHNSKAELKLSFSIKILICKLFQDLQKTAEAYNA